MKVLVQTVQGREYAFELKQGASMATIRFWEIFERKLVGIAEGQGFCALNPGAIEKVEFQPVVSWRPQCPDNLLHLKVISEESYQSKLRDLMENPRAADGLRPGKVVQGVLELTLASGRRDHLDFMVMLRPQYQQALSVWELFHKPPFPILGSEGGFVLYNSANICMIKMYPAITSPNLADFEVASSQSASGDPAHDSSSAAD